MRMEHQMTGMIPASAANVERFELGEGPLWDSRRKRALWVDIRQGTVFEGVLDDDGAIEIVDRFAVEGTIGALAIAASGRMLLARRHHVAIRDEQGSVRDGIRLIDDDPGRRLNDGKPDPAGRFVVGSLRLDGDSTTEELIRIEDDGRRTVIDDDLTLANGLAWSADGTVMYSIDTMRRVVFRRSYDPVTGAAGARIEILRLEEGYPDGMCLDAEGHLWIAIWGLGQVRRYTPSGDLVTLVEVPAPHTSSVAFIGEELDTLLITTATQDLTEHELARYPDSGRIFTAVPGVRGIPQPLWNDRPNMIDHHEDLT
jgi:sugar lactone lactonase YvrE